MRPSFLLQIWKERLDEASGLQPPLILEPTDRNLRAYCPP